MSSHLSLTRRILLLPDRLRFTRRAIIGARQFSSSSRIDDQQKPNASFSIRKIERKEERSPESHLRPATNKSISRVIDARSLGASQLGNNSKVLRAPALLRSRPGQPSRSRKAGNTAKTAKSNPNTNNQKKSRRTLQKVSDDSREEAAIEAEIENILYEQEKKERPKPTRYNPAQYDFASLKETWPPVPIGDAGQASSIYEKLALTSDRYANGYNTPRELAQKLYRGEQVFFRGEEEKRQVLEEVKNIAQDRADIQAQRKGDSVEPEDVSFNPLTNEEQNELIARFVTGEYTTPKLRDEGNYTVMNEVIRNIANNETYRCTDKQAQLLGKLEALLTLPPRAKR